MGQEKRELDTEKREEPGLLGQDVYESATKFNARLAGMGSASLYALGKVSGQMTDSHIVTAVGGMVVGALGFFGNRYFRCRGDDSAYSYMGSIVGGVQFAAGFSLLALEAFNAYYNTGEASSLMNVLNLAGTACAVTESTLVLMNAYLYSDGPPKATPVARPKMD
jgi:uncharacterized membrane protein YgdD (TMEM256/DUF423 family)